MVREWSRLGRGTGREGSAGERRLSASDERTVGLAAEADVEGDAGLGEGVGADDLVSVGACVDPV